MHRTDQQPFYLVTRKSVKFVAEALKDLLRLKEDDQKEIEDDLKELLEKQRGALEEITVDDSEYDETLAMDEGDEEGENIEKE